MPGAATDPKGTLAWVRDTYVIGVAFSVLMMVIAFAAASPVILAVFVLSPELVPYLLTGTGLLGLYITANREEGWEHAQELVEERFPDEHPATLGIRARLQFMVAMLGMGIAGCIPVFGVTAAAVAAAAPVSPALAVLLSIGIPVADTALEGFAGVSLFGAGVETSSWIGRHVPEVTTGEPTAGRAALIGEASLTLLAVYGRV